MKPNWSEIWKRKGDQNYTDSISNESLVLQLMKLNGYDGKHGTHSIETFKAQVDLLVSQFHQIATRADAKIFEIGCGAGAFLRVLEEEYDFKVGGMDFSYPLLFHANNNTKAKLGLFKSEANDDVGIRGLDLVFSHGVFHYFSSEEYALEVLNSMSLYLAEDKPTGLAVMDVRNIEKATLYFQFRTESSKPQDWISVGHRLYSKDFFRDSLSDLGFKKIQIMDSEITKYGNSPYSFNVFAFRS